MIATYLLFAALLVSLVGLFWLSGIVLRELPALQLPLPQRPKGECCEAAEGECEVPMCEVPHG